MMENRSGCERFKIRQAAEDRKKELEEKGLTCSMYKGHREYVLEYK